MISIELSELAITGPLPVLGRGRSDSGLQVRPSHTRPTARPDDTLLSIAVKSGELRCFTQDMYEQLLGLSLYY
jgi:hypothetical protein